MHYPSRSANPRLISRALRGLVGVAVGALAVLPAHRADAEIGAIHPDVIRHAAAVREAKGAEAYAALRELWRTWDRADPTHVEEAIGSVALDPSTPPPVRVYAELLGAYARRRRGDLDGAVAKVEKLGFVARWITVGPFDNDNKTGFERAYGPELELLAPIVPGRAFDGKERPVRWRVPPTVQGYGWFDFGDLMRPREQVCAYATTFARGKPGTRVPRPVSLWMGSSGAFKLFWNGQSVLEDAAYRDIDADRFVTTVSLGAGWNRLTVKVCGDKEAPKFALRIGDERGAPDRGVEVRADAEVTAPSPQPPAATPPAPAAAKSKPAAAGGLRGPIQEFERAIAGASPPPAMLEAYARYLAISGGDPAAEHKARDLASRAASAAPTVRRLLLAGALAEDRNQQRDWVERAAKLAGEGHRDLDVYLAEAQLARSSTNWRDAVPIYERMLAIDPDSVSAILGHVDLYVEAGLKRTALQTLEQAVRRQPTAVSLLRAYAVQLRTVARDAEADEVEARYAALRFDDSGYLSQKVELAVARRDPAGAERWLDRLLRSEPDSAWARSVAARTYRALGQNDRALQAYQRALLMAPEDVATLRALSDLYGEDGEREEQLKALRQILAIHPQAKDVREYVEHIEPPRPRADEAYAWAPERFLPMRVTGKQPYPRRTLRNLTVTTVFPNGLASNFRQVVFQPLTDEAAASGRQYSFAYHGDRQTVQLRGAKVYRADGKIDEAIESGEGAANNPAIAMYTSQRTFYVNFPRLNAGDVVELRYRVEDVVARNEISDYFGEIEYLQSDEPIASSEYVLITPKARTFHTFVTPLRGLAQEVKEEGDRRIYRWAVSDVPPISPEPAMPAWTEVLAHVHVSTFKTWEQVGAWYWGLAREQFDVDDEVRRKAREITKGLTDDKAKVRAVYKYATDLRYVALEFGIEGIRPRRCALTLARGWGDCKDKATLIVTMLRELGVPSTIVLVRTGMRGDVESSPASLAPFDHAIAYVPSLDLYLDGTAENSGSLELPAMDRSAFALQINEGTPKLVRLPQAPAEESASRRKVEITLGADGSTQIGLDLQVTGVHAASLRDRYLADESTRRDRLTRDLSSDFGPIELAAGKAGLDVNDLDDVEQPVKFKARGKAPTLARREGDTVSLPAGPPQRLVAEYAALSTRTLDVVLHAMTLREDEYIVKLPPGAEVIATPTPQKLDTPYGRFEIEVERAPGKVTVKSTLAFKKIRIPPSEYAGWRTFCEAVDRAFGQRIVTSK